MRSGNRFLLLLLLGAGCGEGTVSAGDPAATDSPAGPALPGAAGSGAPTAVHHRCGWIEQNDDAGIASFVAHAAWYDEIHPFYWHLSADGQSVGAYRSIDDAQVMAAAHANHVRVMPLVFFDDVSGLRAMLVDPGRRAQKVAELVGLAQQHGYDGLEIDFEQLFDPADRAGYLAFMGALAPALHAAGKQLSAAVPSLGGSGIELSGNAYDYDALAAELDRIHLMGYDFHGTFHDHAGPIAPLGWLRAVMDHVARTGRPGVFVLGLANYSVTPGTHRSASDAQRLCGGAGAYATVDDHMATCPFGHFDAGRAPHCSIGGAMTYFEDAGSIAEKVELARDAGIGGIAYFPLGAEQSDLLATFARYY